MGQVDEVVVVDDHITGVLSEHQAGKLPRHAATGIKMKGRRSTPGRYFQVAEPGTGWGGTDIADPLAILEPFDPKAAWPGLRLLMVSTTGEHAAYYVLDEQLRPVETAAARAAASPSSSASARTASRRCRTVLFMGGAGGSLRAGVTENPVRLTRSVKERADPRHLRRRAGLCLAGRRHHLHGRRDARAGRTPSATCRRRRSSRRSSSP